MKKRKPQSYAARNMTGPVPVTAWCYICSTPHAWRVACPPVPRYKVVSRYAVSRR